MKNLNRVTLIGNLGDTPNFQKLNGDISLAKITIATSESYRDSSGNLKTDTEWHTVIFWRSLADIAHSYLKKGSLVYIEGKLKTRTFEDKEGNNRFVTEIIGEQLIMLDKKE